MVRRGVAERADRDRILRHRQGMADAPGLLDGQRSAERLGQVRGDGRGLRQDPEWLGTPDLVASARGGIILARGKRERRIHDRIHAGQLAEALGHERARAVMQEGRIGMPSQSRDHRVALVAARADRVEHAIAHAQHARHQIEVARHQLRLEQIEEVSRRAGAARQDRFVRGRRLAHRSVPVAHVLDEILIADIGAIEPAVARGNDGGFGGCGNGHGADRNPGKPILYPGPRVLPIESCDGRANAGPGIATAAPGSAAEWHETGLAAHARQPVPDRRVGREVEAAISGHVGVGEQGDVGHARRFADQVRVGRQMLFE